MLVLRTLQRFMRLAKRRSGDSRGSLKVLPLDILLIITEYLPDASVFSLALTCHTLNDLILCRFPFCRFPSLDAYSKEEFLQLLEKDISNVYYCHECVRLHSWKSRRKSSRRLETGDKSGCYSEYGVSLPLYPHAWLPYPVARGVMNRHFHETSGGPSIKSLNLSWGPDTLSHSVKFASKTHSRIVDDELLLLTTAEIWHSSGDGFELRRLVDETNLKICEHLTLGKDEGHYTHRIPEFDLHPACITDFYQVPKALGSCSVCQTDYTVEVDRHKKKGWVVRLDIYQLLGDCRSPKDWAWNHWVTDDEFGVRRSDLTSPGMIRSRWNIQDQEVPEPEGDFVACPPKHALLNSPTYSRGSSCTICQGQAHCTRSRPSSNGSLLLDFSY